MRGSSFHCEVLIGRIAAALRARGVEFATEVPIRVTARHLEAARDLLDPPAEVGSRHRTGRSRGGRRPVSTTSGRMVPGMWFGDLLIQDDRLVLVEAERSTRRIERDLVKAIARGANELWIVAAHREDASRFGRYLSARGHHTWCRVMTLGQVLARVDELFFPTPRSFDRLSSIREVSNPPGASP